jgi:hypothetical protein
VSQISQPDAADLLNKLLSERIPVSAFFVSSTGTRVSIPGFVDSVTSAEGVVVSISGPPIDVSRGYLTFLPQDCDFSYGEKRELPEELRFLSPERGDSALLLRRPSGERLVLFFTV